MSHQMQSGPDEHTRSTSPTIGIVTALEEEYAAVLGILDAPFPDTKPGMRAGRRYVVGRVASADGIHTIVLALAAKGNNAASARAGALLDHYPGVQDIIMVGIAGGVPNPMTPDQHVRLGDVVVSNEFGVVQYDFDKESIDGVQYRHPPRPPSAHLSEAVRLFEASALFTKESWLPILQDLLLKLKVKRPPTSSDVLLSAADPAVVLTHPRDKNRKRGQPRLFFAPIASANKLLKNPQKRDFLGMEFGVRAIEMEASGVADTTWTHGSGYLVIRGICDYCDSSKNDEWHKYAAVVSAAYTKALLNSMPSGETAPGTPETGKSPDTVVMISRPNRKTTALARTLCQLFNRTPAFPGSQILLESLDVEHNVAKYLARTVHDTMPLFRPHLQHLAEEGDVSFNRTAFHKHLRVGPIDAQTPDGLTPALVPILTACVDLPGASGSNAETTPVFEAVVNSALRALWKRLSRSGADGIAESRAATLSASDAECLIDFTNFAERVSIQVYDRLFDSAPPLTHLIDREEYHNPFALARAEDFNHNYQKLAQLFHDAPEWGAIQSRTENVFIEGSRGTGKSMLLRRLTAQATVAARRLSSASVTFDEVTEDYFGVYIKLARGYYDQLERVDGVAAPISRLLAQHELNIEVFDAFVDALMWLESERALPKAVTSTTALVDDLSQLLPRAPSVTSLSDLKTHTVAFEQNAIIEFYRAKAFELDTTYVGSACDTMMFIRRLAGIFRRRLFPHREVRLFLLLDEFESLLDSQQLAVNTLMKMRLPDLSVKVAVRKAGRKTSDTFTHGDPIQQPRDYTEIRLDYKVDANEYLDLLRGIAQKRLEYAGYDRSDIDLYLSRDDDIDRVPEEDIDAEILTIWDEGARRTEAVSREFSESYRRAALYRLLARSGKRKSFAGFDDFALLASGIVSNFIELCKYAFYLALNDKLPLKQQSTIPVFLQTDAVYRLSQRLLSTIAGNVPVVGSVLARLVIDIGSILRQRLLRHSSEPEANRVSVVNFGELGASEFQLLASVLDGAVVWSVFQMRDEGEAFRPRNESRPSTVELLVNRIYCPALGISPRSRWRVSIGVRELSRLVEPGLRDHAFRALMRSVGSVDLGIDAQPHLPGLEDSI